jgi:hypothetical protein
VSPSFRSRLAGELLAEPAAVGAAQTANLSSLLPTSFLRLPPSKLGFGGNPCRPELGETPAQQLEAKAARHFAYRRAELGFGGERDATLDGENVC